MNRILVLEDNKNLAFAISHVLQEYEVSVCLNARQAYEKLEKPFDCYLLDIGLPDGNGLEICSYIRTFSNRPILILSADRTEESILKGYASLADDYLEKPFLLSVLQAKIKALMHRAVFFLLAFLAGQKSSWPKKKHTHFLYWQGRM
jgi:DNA-binding response OmpR family regulator